MPKGKAQGAELIAAPLKSHRASGAEFFKRGERNIIMLCGTNNNCWIWIILIILIFGCGGWGNGCNTGCNTNNGGCGCGCNTTCC